eukprot:6194834-Pleurochrysis_carterae.AAC.3
MSRCIEVIDSRVLNTSESPGQRGICAPGRLKARAARAKRGGGARRLLRGRRSRVAREDRSSGPSSRDRRSRGQSPRRSTPARARRGGTDRRYETYMRSG